MFGPRVPSVGLGASECVIQFQNRGKLGSQFIDPIRISAQVGKVAYRLDFSDELNQIHNTFHFSHLQKCVAVDLAMISLDDIQVNERLNYVERPIVLLDRKTKAPRNMVMNLVKVQWQQHKGSKLTWEPNDEMKEHYRDLFAIADFDNEV
ncbi:uncharacterized protein LOC111877905 [Lactuca sativa]|uniref:uncharacterized protein LOC111877905 n=1 Tax=Lactuca sativa TaxID=4236 RepID=UPI000CD92A80|nr:uncharacterized protein LOC111877905 [Lactuca sativa]